MVKKIADKLLKDEQGSVLPLITVVMIIFILVGAYQIGNIFVYRDRAIVRDAIDSACTSALTSGTKVESHATRYSENHVVIWSEEGVDELGNVTSPSTLIADYWESTESHSKYNIFLDEGKAEAEAKSNFQKIITGNNIKATLISWDFSVEYDNERYLTVTQHRSHTSLSGWWAYSPHNGSESVKYPRWVKVTITATATVPVPLGGTFGKTNQKFTWKSQAIKELTPNRVT